MRLLLRSRPTAISLATFLALAPFVAAEEPTETEFAIGGIQAGLKRSPDVYLAAVLEIVGHPRCTDANDASTCVADAKLVEVLARHGAEFRPGTLVSIAGGVTMGSRYLAFIVPIEGQPGVYGATFLLVGASDDDRKDFIADLKKAGVREYHP